MGIGLPDRRWWPAFVVPAVVVASAVIIPAASGTGVDLPDRTAAEVLALAAGSNVTGFSGTVEQESALGLPNLPMGQAGAGGAAEALELLAASHTARVFLAAPGQARVQVLDMMAERDVILSDGQAWFYDSANNEATHVTGIAADAPGKASAGLPEAGLADLTPQQLAQQFIAGVDDTTNVTVGTARKVAGRPSYELILTPKTDQTLVGSVSIAVDSGTGMPLGVQVRARGQADPAFSIAYTSIDMATPDASVFAFSPPVGTDVTEQDAAGVAATPDKAPGDHAKPTVVGSGWSAVMTLPSSGPPQPAGQPGQADALIAQLTQPVAGGRALTTSLVSVLITADGRVLAGMVPVPVLQAAAAA